MRAPWNSSSSVSKFTSNFARYSGPRSSTAINQIYAPPRRYVLPYCLGNETSHSRQYYPSKDDHKFDPYPHHGSRGSQCSGGLRRYGGTHSDSRIKVKINKGSTFARFHSCTCARDSFIATEKSIKFLFHGLSLEKKKERKKLPLILETPDIVNIFSNISPKFERTAKELSRCVSRAKVLLVARLYPRESSTAENFLANTRRALNENFPRTAIFSN